jgi:hypothetical protein
MLALVWHLSLRLTTLATDVTGQRCKPEAKEPTPCKRSAHRQTGGVSAPVAVATILQSPILERLSSNSCECCVYGLIVAATVEGDSMAGARLLFAEPTRVSYGRRKQIRSFVPIRSIAARSSVLKSSTYPKV